MIINICLGVIRRTMHKTPQLNSTEPFQTPQYQNRNTMIIICFFFLTRNMKKNNST